LLVDILFRDFTARKLLKLFYVLCFMNIEYILLFEVLLIKDPPHPSREDLQGHQELPMQIRDSMTSVTSFL